MRQTTIDVVSDNCGVGMIHVAVVAAAAFGVEVMVVVMVFATKYFHYSDLIKIGS